MTDNDQSGTRRRSVLKGIGSAAVSGALIAGTTSATVSAEEQYEFLATKRGSFRNPLSEGEISNARTAAFEKYIDRHDALDEFALVETGQDEDTILVGYNIILDSNGRPREQFAARKKASDNRRAREEIGSQEVDGSESLRQEADEMLADGVTMVTSTDARNASSCTEDTCTDEMDRLSGTEMIKTYEVENHPRDIDMAGKAILKTKSFTMRRVNAGSRTHTSDFSPAD